LKNLVSGSAHRSWWTRTTVSAACRLGFFQQAVEVVHRIAIEGKIILERQKTPFEIDYIALEYNSIKKAG
jgi:hypothetical protein